MGFSMSKGTKKVREGKRGFPILPKGSMLFTTGNKYVF